MKPETAANERARMDQAAEFDIAVGEERDLEGIIDLISEVAAEGTWIATEPPVDRQMRRARVQANLERSDTLVLVARNGEGAVVGELTLAPSWPGLFSLGMAVARDWRSKGIGGALLSRAIAWGRMAGGHKVSLEVFPHNAAAIALYERFGFVREGRFRRHLRRKNGELWDTIPMGLLPGKSPGG